MGFEGTNDNEASSSSHGLVDPTSPLLPPHPSAARLSSQTKTFANVFIAIVGSGVLGLPYTFMCTGWAAGALLLAAIAALTFYCMLLLVRTRRRLDLDLDLDRGFSKIASFGRQAIQDPTLPRPQLAQGAGLPDENHRSGGPSVVEGRPGGGLGLAEGHRRRGRRRGGSGSRERRAREKN